MSDTSDRLRSLFLSVSARPNVPEAMLAYGEIFAELCGHSVSAVRVADERRRFLNLCVAQRGTVRPTTSVFGFFDRFRNVVPELLPSMLVTRRAVLIRLRRVLCSLGQTFAGQLPLWPSHVLATIASESLDHRTRSNQLEEWRALSMQDTFTAALTIAEHVKRFGVHSVTLRVLQTIETAWWQGRLTAQPLQVLRLAAVLPSTEEEEDGDVKHGTKKRRRAREDRTADDEINDVDRGKRRRISSQPPSRSVRRRRL